MSDWITINQAAANLGVSPAKIQELIDRGEIDCQEEEDGQTLVLAADVSEMRDFLDPTEPGAPGGSTQPTKSATVNRKSKIKNRKSLNGFPPATDFPNNPKSPAGHPLLTTAQAAKILGVTIDRVGEAMRQGLIDGDKEGGRWMVNHFSLRRYFDRKQKWLALGSYAKYHFAERRRYKAVLAGEDDVRPKKEVALSEPIPYERWISAPEAQETLQLTKTGFRRLAIAEGLTKVRRKVEPPPGANRRAPHTHAFYLMHEIEALTDRRDGQAKRLTPQQWNHDLRRPAIQKLNGPPPAGTITVRQAAEMLGITKDAVHQKVESGRLIAYQKSIGHRGSRIYLSERQIIRLSQDEEYLKRHNARVHGGSSIVDEMDRPGWLRKAGLHDPERVPKKRAIDRGHGELLTTAQAARILGVSRLAVLALRRRGRIQGYRAKSAKAHSHTAWWFFKEADIFALAGDRKYVAARDAAKAAAVTPKERRFPTEEEWVECWKANQMGREPRGAR